MGASWIHTLLTLQGFSAFTKPSGMLRLPAFSSPVQNYSSGLIATYPSLEDYQIMGSLSPVVNSVMQKSRGLTSLSSSSCIYRVPEHLRRTNQEEYTPMVVSIGPLHHGDAKLLPMEEQKVRYLHALLDRTSNKDLTGYVGVIKEHANKVRECYAEKISTSENAFIEMVLLDSAFLIETFLKSNGIHGWEETDRIFSRPGLISQVVRDMKLLENQLPFFILEKLYNFMMQPMSPSEYFRTMTFKFFKVEPRVSIPDIKHFVDLFRTCFLPRPLRDPSKKRKGKIEFRARVMELQEAGVRFEKPGNSSSLLDIKFDKGILKIPQLKLQSDTESFFRSLVAYEHCHHWWDSYIIDYIALLDFLINTPKDVEMLVDKEIIVNWLGNSEEAAGVFKSLFKHCLFKQVNVMSSNFYYSSLCDQLEKFYKSPHHRNIAMLKHNYFGHPWAVISFVTGMLLLVLSFIQAITGVISVSHSGSSNR